MKYSKQRELIYNALTPLKNHPSADELYDMLKKDNPSLSLATVYRNLNQLAENKEIIKVQIPGQKDRFDSNIHEHYHFICNACGKIYDIDKSDIKCPSCLTVDGHSVNSIEMDLRGVCKDCSLNYENN